MEALSSPSYDVDVLNFKKRYMTSIRKRINPPEDDKFKITMISSIYEALNKFLLLPNNLTAEQYFKKI